MISNDLTKANHFSKLKAKLSFCELTPEELSANDKKKLERELRQTSVFFNAATGSIQTENALKIGTFTAAFDPNDSRKTIITQNQMDPMSLLQSFNMSEKINLNEMTYDYKRNELNVKEEYAKLKEEQKNDLENEIKKQQEEQLNLMDHFNDNYCPSSNTISNESVNQTINNNDNNNNLNNNNNNKLNDLTNSILFEDYEQMNSNQLLTSTSFFMKGKK